MRADGTEPAVDAVLKLIMIGDTGAGKSSILHRFIERRHDTRLANTAGVEFGTRTILVDSSKVKLHVWVRQPEPTRRGVTPARRPRRCPLPAGHGRAGAVPVGHQVVLPRRRRLHHRLRFDQPRLLRAREGEGRDGRDR